MRSFYTLLFVISFQISHAQLSAIDQEIKENLANFRNATISFGLDTTVTYMDFKGKKVTKKIFNVIGTGVMFYIKSKKNEIITCIITAKHVLFDPAKNWVPKKLKIRFSESDSLQIDKYFGIEVPLYETNGKANWISHPDSMVDAACLIPLISEPNVRIPHFTNIPYSFFPNDDEYYEGREIYVLGYPGAVGPDLLTRAVIRRGIIAWVPPSIDDNGKILIDCNIFPGNSGGPVFFIPKNSGFIMSDTIPQKPRFFGIVSERRFSNNYIVDPSGKIITDNTGKPINSFESIGIGVVVSAKKIRELLEYTGNRVQ